MTAETLDQAIAAWQRFAAGERSPLTGEDVGEKAEAYLRWALAQYRRRAWLH